MIVKMSFVTLAGPKSDIDRIIDTYLSKYEIQLENALVELNSSGNLLPYVEANPYKEILDTSHELIELMDGPGDSPLTDMTVDEATGIINDVDSKIKSFRLEIDALNLKKQHLEEDYGVISPFKSLNYNLKEVLDMNYIKYRFGRVPRDTWDSFQSFIAPDLEAVFIDCLVDGNYIWGVYFAPEPYISKVDDAFNSLHFEAVKVPDNYEGTPAEACITIAKMISEVDENIKTIESKISNLVEVNKSKVLSACNRIELAYGNFDVRKLAACTKQANVVFHILCGWMATEDAHKLAAETEDDVNVVCMIDNDTSKKRTPPTKLKNPKIAKPFEMFIKMYGLPAYGEFDPTLFVAITYSLLFGAMFGDLGQGLCLAIGGLLIYYFKKIPLAAIIASAGFCSAFFGLLYGSVFGFEDVIKGLWINPRNSTINLPIVGDFNTVFVAAILFGVFLILITMIINMINAIKTKNYADFLIGPNGLTGFVFYLSVMAVVILYMTGHTLPGTIILVIMFGVPLVIIALKAPLVNLVEKNPKLFPESAGMYFVEGFFELFEMLLNYFSNTLSFLRVGAFAISHGAMMEVVMTLAGASDGHPNILVLILGNIFVCGMEGLIVGIQGLRLEYYELFGRFYTGTGKEFKPYSKNIKK